MKDLKEYLRVAIREPDFWAILILGYLLGSLTSPVLRLLLG